MGVYLIHGIKDPETNRYRHLWKLVNRLGNLHIREYFENLGNVYVTDQFNHRISFIRATVRYFGKILSSLTLLVGFIMAAFTQKKQALHDMLAGCLVVNVE